MERATAAAVLDTKFGPFLFSRTALRKRENFTYVVIDKKEVSGYIIDKKSVLFLVG